MNKLLLGIGLAVGLAVTVEAQVSPPLPARGVIGANPGLQNTWTNLTLPGVITSGATSNFTSQPYAIVNGCDLGLDVTLFGTNSSTTNETFYVNLSSDGTNWMTTPPLTYVVALNGTNVVNAYTNFPSFFFNSAAYARLEKFKNADTAATNAVWLTRVLLERAQKPLQ